MGSQVKIYWCRSHSTARQGHNRKVRFLIERPQEQRKLVHVVDLVHANTGSQISFHSDRINLWTHLDAADPFVFFALAFALAFGMNIADSVSQYTVASFEERAFA